MIQTQMGFIHAIFAVAALISGFIVVLRIKGDRLHRWTGWVYVASMILMNLTALLTHAMFTFGVFHYLALFSLATVIAGIMAPLYRRKISYWMKLHLEMMLWSYAGLVAALFAEVAVRLPIEDAPSYFWALVAGASALVLFGSVPLINRSKNRYLKRT